MKFNEKLQSLRKAQKMSQEQLADMLDVSRQAVSKWESGQTYPEMDKLISMCKIFHCTLDDLTNDEIKEIPTEEKKDLKATFLEEMVAYINKTFAMFKTLNGKQIAHLIAEMLFVLILLIVLHIPIEYIYQLGSDIFHNLGPTIAPILSSIWNFILEVMYIVFAIFAFLYIFKIRFLDSFREEKESEPILEEKKVSVLEEKKIVSLPKEKEPRKGFVIFSVLGSLFMIFLRGCAVITSLPFLFSLFIVSLVMMITILLFFKGVFFLGVVIGCVAAIGFIVLLLEVLINFIFNRKTKVRKFIVVLLSSIALFGVGVGITIFDIASIRYIDEVPEGYTLYEKEATVPMTERLYIHDYWYNDNITYQADANLNDQILLKVSYYNDKEAIRIDVVDNAIHFRFNTDTEWDYPELFHSVIGDLQKKQMHNYGKIRQREITVYGTQENLVKLQQNFRKIKEEEDALRDSYQMEIDRQQEEIRALQEKLSKALEENSLQGERYQQEIDQLQATIQEYKDKISELLAP